MADVQISAPGKVAAPLTYTVPQAGEIVIKALFASFDGTGAAGSFLPCAQIVSDNGVVVGTYPVDTAVAAGASADVSWFPRLRRTVSGGLGVCGETDVTLANPGIYLAAAGHFTNAVTLPALTDHTETIACTHKVTSGDYVVLLVGVGSATFTETGSGDKFNVDYVPWNVGGGFTPNPAQNPTNFINTVGLSGPDLGFYQGGAGGTNIITYASSPALSNADINVADTFRLDIDNGSSLAGTFEIGQRAYAVVGIPAAALSAVVGGSPNIGGGSASSNGGAAGFEYLIPSGSYAPNSPQDMAHIYGLAAPGYPFTTSEPVTFIGAKSVRLSHVHIVPGGSPGADPVDFWFDVAVRMHRNSYAGSCFRILLPPSSSPPIMPRWSAAGQTLAMATSS